MSRIRQGRLATRIRSYLLAAALNWALLNSVLTPPVRQRAALVLVAEAADGFRPTELIARGVAAHSVLSLPYQATEPASFIQSN